MLSHRRKDFWHTFTPFSDGNTGVLLTKNLYATLRNKDCKTPTEDEEKMRREGN